jgi:hypothetical protein
VLHLTRSQIAEKFVEVQQAACVEEMEKAKAQLRMELDAAQLKLAEVERRELALTSVYEDLKTGFQRCTLFACCCGGEES